MEKIKDLIEKKVFDTPFIDTHEHLIDESERLDCLESIIPCDDWSLLLNHYFAFDLISAGISKEKLDKLFSKQLNSIGKWQILNEYWRKLGTHTLEGLILNGLKPKKLKKYLQEKLIQK